MTWALPFLFIHFLVRSGIPAESAGVVLRFVLFFFLGCCVLFLMQSAARRYLLPSPQARRARIAHTYRGGS